MLILLVNPRTYLKMGHLFCSEQHHSCSSRHEIGLTINETCETIHTHA